MAVALNRCRGSHRLGQTFFLIRKIFFLPRIELFSRNDESLLAESSAAIHGIVGTPAYMVAPVVDKIMRLAGNAHHEFHHSLMNMWPELALPVSPMLSPLRNYLQDKSTAYTFSGALSFKLSSNKEDSLITSEVDIYQSLCAISGKISKLDCIFLRVYTDLDSATSMLHNPSLYSVLLESRSTFLSMRNPKAVEFCDKGKTEQVIVGYIITWDMLVKKQRTGEFVPHKRPTMKGIRILDNRSPASGAAEGETCLMMNRGPYHRLWPKGQKHGSAPSRFV